MTLEGFIAQLAKLEGVNVGTARGLLDGARAGIASAQEQAHDGSWWRASLPGEGSRRRVAGEVEAAYSYLGGLAPEFPAPGWLDIRRAVSDAAGELDAIADGNATLEAARAAFFTDIATNAADLGAAVAKAAAAGAAVSLLLPLGLALAGAAFVWWVSQSKD